MDPLLFQTLIRHCRKLRRTLYLVGGPPRDLLLGRPCRDWDLAGRRAKDAAAAVARRFSKKLIALNEQHKIYRVVLSRPQGPLMVDFVELHEGSIEKDLRRRDFTVNAMAIPLAEGSLPSLNGERLPQAGEVLDPLNGRRDLRRKILRAASSQTFGQDPLRILRAFRLSAQLHLRIESSTLAAMRAHLDKHRQPHLGVAAERVRAELLLFFSQATAGKILGPMDSCGVVRSIFPQMEACRRTAVRFHGKGGVLGHSFRTVENLDWIFQQIESQGAYRESLFPAAEARDGIESYLREELGGFPRCAWLKWAALLHDIGKPATAQLVSGRLRFFGHEDAGAVLAQQTLERLRSSRLESQHIGRWVQNHMRLGNLAAAQKLTDKAVARYFRDLGSEGLGMLLVSLADHYDYLKLSQRGKLKDPVERTARRMFNAYFSHKEVVQPVRLIDGHQLMRRLKLKPGPLVGSLLAEVQDAQAEGKIKTPAEAIAWAERRYEKGRLVKPRRLL